MAPENLTGLLHTGRELRLGGLHWDSEGLRKDGPIVCIDMRRIKAGRPTWKEPGWWPTWKKTREVGLHGKRLGG